MSTPAIRNIAIIAHVDHGKTTLVDQLFRQSGAVTLKEDGETRLMDSMELERERGITIAAKNCSVRWGGVKINILDTPGHADFGGEVERALMMVDGCVLLVDCAEGPLPQTRFVVSKALARGLPIIVCLNKIDRKDGRPEEVLDQIYDLFIDLGANDQQIEFPVLYAIGRDGRASRDLNNLANDLTPLFEAILSEIPAPVVDASKPFQLHVLDLGYSNYHGRLAVGKVMNGRATSADKLVCVSEGDKLVQLRSVKLQEYAGMSMVDATEANAGDIVIVAGADEVTIGDTICAAQTPLSLPRVAIDPPTISMKFTTNDSPLGGREGKFVQPQRIWARLEKEARHNVSLEVEGSEATSTFIVKGRGEFQMAIIVETMRREGFELALGRPEVIFREQNGEVVEPIERLEIECEDGHVGVITEKLARRKGRMTDLQQDGSGRSKLTFSIPSRGLIGYRSEFLTDTRGLGILNSYVEGFEPHRGEVTARTTGSLVADRFGEAVAYALFNLEPRGKLFIKPGDEVYPGMVIGEHTRDNDLYVNPCKGKKLTNMRASGKDENVQLTPATRPTLEEAIEFIKADELVEVTPAAIRMRKIELPRAKG